MVSTASLYASNCSSSVGRCVLSMNRNSERKSPTPSPSHSMAFLASFGVPMLQYTSSLSPSAVRVSFPMNFLSSAFFLMNSSRFLMYFARTSPSGLMKTSPSVPSMIATSLSSTESTMPGTESTAGISSALASMAEWEVGPPTSVMMPDTFSFTICEVIEGVRSLHTSTVPCGTLPMSMSSMPRSFFRMHTFTSVISAALWRIISSSIPENMPWNMSHTAVSADSAHCPLSIMLNISPDIAGSWIITACPMSMSAS